ncbi:hypothetical protein [Kribbella sp. NPDC055071]
MADLLAVNVLRRIHQLVVADTEGWSDEPPEVPDQLEQPLKDLGETLDIPARLVSGPDGQDRRPEIRTAVTAAFALSARELEPSEDLLDSGGRLPAAAGPADRERLGRAVSEAYAHFAAPRLVAGLFPNGRADDLGRFPLAVPEGDVAAGQALALAIAARTGTGQEQVLTRLVAAGRGGTGPAAAQMLLRLHPGYAQLPRPEREALLRSVSDTVESGFATRDLQAAAQRELTEFRENRRPDIAGGVAAINTASAAATKELGDLHRFLDTLPEWHPANQERAAIRAASRGAEIGRPASVPEVMERIQGAVAALTDTRETLWSGNTETLRGDPSGRAIRLTEAQGLALMQLMENGPLSSEQVAAVQSAYLTATASLAGWAVPDGNTSRNEEAAASVAPRFTRIEQAVLNAFSEDNVNQIIDRTLPADTAARIRPQAPRVDGELAPIARGLASAIDTAAGLPAGETLRRMAGQDRSGMAWAAAERLVPNSPEKPFVVQRIAAVIDKRFDALPPHIDDPEQYGQRVGELAAKIAKLSDASPEWDAAGGRVVAEGVQLDQPTEAPASTYELVQRIQGAVGRLTGAPDSLWNGEYDASPGDVPAPSAKGDLRLSFGADLALAQLTATADRYPILTALRDPSGNIRSEDLAATRDGIAEAARACAQWAVPAGHSREAEARAEQDPELDGPAGPVWDAFVDDNYYEILEGVLPPDLADQVKAAGPPTRAELAPAALGLALAVDEANGRSMDDPSATLRHLAGQPRADIARSAAAGLVPPAAVEEAAERIRLAFKVLPTQADTWREAGVGNDELAEKVHLYGYKLAEEVQALGHRPEDHLRFAKDEALTTHRPQAPVNAPNPTTVGSDQSKQRGMDAR